MPHQSGGCMRERVPMTESYGEVEATMWREIATERGLLTLGVPPKKVARKLVDIAHESEYDLESILSRFAQRAKDDRHTKKIKKTVKRARKLAAKA